MIQPTHDHKPAEHPAQFVGWVGLTRANAFITNEFSQLDYDGDAEFLNPTYLELCWVDEFSTPIMIWLDHLNWQ